MKRRGVKKSQLCDARAEALNWCSKRDPPWIVEGDAGRMGRGVFCAKALQEGDFIVQYYGELVSAKVGNAREKISPSCYRYFFSHCDKRYCIDATTEPIVGPRLGRLVNHGDLKEDQNCKMRVVGVANKPFLCLFASRNITFGEQILYDYGVAVPWIAVTSVKACSHNSDITPGSRGSLLEQPLLFESNIQMIGNQQLRFKKLGSVGSVMVQSGTFDELIAEQAVHCETLSASDEPVDQTHGENFDTRDMNGGKMSESSDDPNDVCGYSIQHAHRVDTRDSAFGSVNELNVVSGALPVRLELTQYADGEPVDDNFDASKTNVGNTSMGQNDGDFDAILDLNEEADYDNNASIKMITGYGNNAPVVSSSMSILTVTHADHNMDHNMDVNTMECAGILTVGMKSKLIETDNPDICSCSASGFTLQTISKEIDRAGGGKDFHSARNGSDVILSVNDNDQRRPEPDEILSTDSNNSLSCPTDVFDSRQPKQVPILMIATTVTTSEMCRPCDAIERISPDLVPRVSGIDGSRTSTILKERPSFSICRSSSGTPNSHSLCETEKKSIIHLVKQLPGEFNQSHVESSMTTAFGTCIGSSLVAVDGRNENKNVDRTTSSSSHGIDPEYRLVDEHIDYIEDSNSSSHHSYSDHDYYSVMTNKLTSLMLKTRVETDPDVEPDSSSGDDASYNVQCPRRRVLVNGVTGDEPIRHKELKVREAAKSLESSNHVSNAETTKSLKRSHPVQDVDVSKSVKSSNRKLILHHRESEYDDSDVDPDYAPTDFSDSSSTSNYLSDNELVKRKCKKPQVRKAAKSLKSSNHVSDAETPKNLQRSCPVQIVEMSENLKSSNRIFNVDTGSDSGTATTNGDMNVSQKWSNDGSTVGTSFDKKTHVSLLQKRAVSGNAKKAYDKCHFCKFCGTRIVNKIQRHLLTVHQVEEEVKQILFLPQRSKERSLLLKRLINEGNFQHNIDVLKEGSGHLVVGRRSELNTKTANSYTVCVYCKSWQSKSNLWRHMKTCNEKIEYHKNHPVTVNGEKPKVRAVKSGQSLVNSAVFDEKDNNLSPLVNRMRNDDVKEVALSDPLIRRVAGLRLAGLGREVDQKQDDMYRVSQSARLLGRILLQARQTKPEISFTDLLVPSNFDFVVNIAKQMSTEKKEPSLNVGKAIGLLLTKTCESKYCSALRMSNTNDQTHATNFTKLIETEWNNRVNRCAIRRINSEKRTKIHPVPVTEDLQLFRSFLIRNIRELSDRLRKRCNSRDWVMLAKCTMSRLILFNKRRRNEVRELKVNDYLARPNWRNNDCGEMAMALSSTHRLLANRMDMVINAGKSRKNIEAFVLLPPDARAAVDLLIECRTSVGVPSTNVYIFSRLSADSSLAGHTEMRELALQCEGLKFPERITSRALRTYIATVSQILDMNQSELEHLSRHLGHDEKTHKEFYRLSHSTVQLSKVARMLMAVEKGHLHKFRGKSLDDVIDADLPDIIDNEDDEDVEPEDSSNALTAPADETGTADDEDVIDGCNMVTASVDVTENADKEPPDTEKVHQGTKQFIRRAKSKNDFDQSTDDTRSVSKSESVSQPKRQLRDTEKKHQKIKQVTENTGSMHNSAVNSKDTEIACKHKRPRWSSSELDMLFETFGAYITRKEMPSGKQLKEFAERISYSRSVLKIRTQLDNIMKGKVKCHFADSVGTTE